MNKKNLVKIIKREVSILADFIDGFEDGESIHPMEVDLALSKAKDIYDELLLLKTEGRVVENVRIKLEEKPVKEYKESETELLPKEIAEEKIPLQTEPELVDIKQPEAEILPESIQIPVAVNEPSIQAMELLETEVEEPENEIEDSEQQKVDEVVKENIENSNNADKEEYVDNENLVKDSDKDILPVEKEIIVSSNEELVTEANNKSEIVADKFSKGSLSLNEMLAGIKQNKDLASLLKDSPILDLKKAIKVNDRIWFINELFNKKSASFDKTIEAVNSSANLDQALEFLFTNFKWDQERKSTISFLELVFRRFASK